MKPVQPIYLRVVGADVLLCGYNIYTPVCAPEPVLQHFCGFTEILLNDTPQAFRVELHRSAFLQSAKPSGSRDGDVSATVAVS